MHLDIGGFHGIDVANLSRIVILHVSGRAQEHATQMHEFAENGKVGQQHTDQEQVDIEDRTDIGPLITGLEGHQPDRRAV